MKKASDFNQNFTNFDFYLQGTKEVHVEKLFQCPGVNTSIVLNNALLNYQKTVMNVNAQFTLKRPVGGKIDVSMNC